MQKSLTKNYIDRTEEQHQSEVTKMIQEIFAEGAYGVRVYEGTAEPYDGYIINCYLKIYEISDDLTDVDEEEVYGGELGGAVRIGTVMGLLILAGRMPRRGWTSMTSATALMVMRSLSTRL